MACALLASYCLLISDLLNIQYVVSGKSCTTAHMGAAPTKGTSFVFMQINAQWNGAHSAITLDRTARSVSQEAVILGSMATDRGEPHTVTETRYSL
jgi:hypothetical protein